MQRNSSSTTTNITTKDIQLLESKQKRNIYKADTTVPISYWSPPASPTPKQEQASKKEVTKNGEIAIYDDFEKMGLQEEILRGVFAYGFEKPSAIQQRAIVPSIQGRDVVAQAQSGTGKTATFSISMLQQLDISKKYCQV